MEFGIAIIAGLLGGILYALIRIGNALEEIAEK